MEYSKYFKSINYESLSASAITDSNEKKLLEPYIKNLYTAIEDPTVKNIAVFGKFGAGKTTVINTFLDDTQQIKDGPYKFILKAIQKYARMKYGWLQRVKPEQVRPLRLSTATFTRTNEPRNTSDKDTGWIEIERNLVQQMLYGPKNKILPNSKFRKIEKPGKIKWIVIAILLIALFISGSLITGMGNILGLFLSNSALVLAKESLFCIFLVAFATLVLFGFWYLPPYLKSAKLALGKNELNVADNRSALNQYLDEIIYYFSQTKYNLVVFEDIDRAENLNIFEHLRELNQILNSSQLIQEKYKVHGNEPAIRFLYAVKEDLFDNQMLSYHDGSLSLSEIRHTNMETEIAEATTKFFDWTLTVLPRVSASNAADFLMHVFEEPSPSFKTFLRGVGGYFKDVRILENAINDLKLYLSLQQGEDLDAEKLFTVLLFKNGYPTEYQRFLRDEGMLSQVLRSRYFAEKFTDKLQSELETLLLEKKRIIEITEQNVINRYFRILLSAGLDKNSSVKSEDSTVRIDQILNMDFASLQNLYTHVRSSNTKIVYDSIDYYGRRSNHYLNADVLIVSEENFDSDLIFSGDSISEVTQNVESQIQQKRDAIATVESQSLTKIASKNPSLLSETLSDTGDSQGFLTFAILNGYLDETTDDYLTLFTGERISRRDRATVLKIRSGQKVPFDQRIDNIANFSAELIGSDLNMPSIALYNLILYGLTANSSDPVNNIRTIINAAIKQLSKQEAEQFTAHLDELVKKLQDHDSLKRLIDTISNALNFDWSKYDGNQIQRIAPLLLSYTQSANIQRLINSSSPLIDYLNENQWADSLTVVANKPEMAEIIYSSDQVILKQLDAITQAKRPFIEFLIKHKAVACLPETLNTLLLAYRINPDQSLSYRIAISERNEILKEYIDERGQQFIESELKLGLLDNETQKSMTALLKLPGTQTKTLKLALEKYLRQDLILHDFKPAEEVENQVPTTIELIVTSGKAQLSWENLAELVSLPNNDGKQKVVNIFIKQTDNFVKLPQFLNDQEKETLRKVVNSYPILASRANKSVLENVSEYSVISQDEETRNQLIKWQLAKLDDGILDIGLEQQQLIELSERYLVGTFTDWDERQQRLFGKLSTSTLVSIITNSNHELRRLRNEALAELTTQRIDELQFSDEMRLSIIEDIIGQGSVEGDKQYLIDSYRSLRNVDSQIASISQMCAISDSVIPDTLIVELLSASSISGINQIADSTLLTMKVQNRNGIPKLLDSLNERKLTGKIKVTLGKKSISVPKLAKLKNFQ